jgi:hypothetical protein
MTPERIKELREYVREMGAHRPEMLRMRECLDEIERLRDIIETAEGRLANAADGLGSAQGYLHGAVQALKGES